MGMTAQTNALPGVQGMALKESHLRVIETAALFGVSFTLIDAFYFQLVWGELPCAFCNLIRVSLMIFGGGLLLNLRFGFNPWNYVLSAIGALIGSLISLLFLFVKAPPSSVPTGSTVFGLSMYGWTFIICTAAIMYCVFMLAFNAQKAPASKAATPSSFDVTLESKILPPVMWLFIFLVGANLVSSFLQNGFGTYKRGGQIHYEMLHNGDPYKP